MHTIMIIAAGFVVLAVSIGIGHLRGGAAGRARAARLYIPVWFVLALINVTIGVVSAGYTVMQEAPVFLVTFGVPAALAFIVSRRSAST